MNGVDPMANLYSSLTPYNFSFNDPVAFTEPNGADPNCPTCGCMICGNDDRNGSAKLLASPSQWSWMGDPAGAGTAWMGPSYDPQSGQHSMAERDSYGEWGHYFIDPTGSTTRSVVATLRFVAVTGQGQVQGTKQNALDWILDWFPGERDTGSKVISSAGTNFSARVSRVFGATFNPMSQVLYQKDWTNKGNSEYIPNDNDGTMKLHQEFGFDYYILGGNYERIIDTGDEFGHLDGSYKSDSREYTVNISVLTFKINSDNTGTTLFYGFSLGGKFGIGVGGAVETWYGNKWKF